MKNFGAPLLAIVGSPQMFMADCYTVTLVDGTVLRYTTADQDIVDQATGHVFSSKGPLLNRSKVKFSTGVEVDELDITLTAGPNDLVEGTQWFAALKQGFFDGAELQLDRAFMATFGDTSAGLVTIYAGRIVECDWGRSQATIKVNTHLELLNLQWPWRLFQAACPHTLYDARCTLNPAGFTKTGAITSAIAPTISTFSTNMTDADGTYTFGTITFTSGANAGIKRSIKIYVNASGQMRLLVPLGTAPAVGDTFTARAGCDKTQNSCKNKFSNLANFGGMPYVPVPETAV